jgi:hypothetical protein
MTQQDHMLATQICMQARTPVFLWGAPGVGKCLGAGTPVLRYDGRAVAVESIKTGDLLMGPDSVQRRVLSTSAGTGPLYRIVPIKGDSWICNDAHILTLVHSITGEVVDIPLNDYLKLNAEKKHYYKLFQPAGGVDYATPSGELPVTPYFVGAWLGDGTKSLTHIAVTKPDAEIEQACRAEAARFGLHVRVEVIDGKCPTYHLFSDKGAGVGSGRTGLYNPLLDAMRVLMTANGERRIGIPDAYLYGSREVRMEVLAGLCDTDGWARSGGYEIVQEDVGIADDLCVLARSLGFRVTRKVKVVKEWPYQRMSLIGDCSKIPVRIARKRVAPRLQKKNPLRTGFRVEAVGDGPYFGFTLDADGRFLLGDFTVTHNTVMLEEISPALGEPMWTVILSIREPSDQGGLPIIRPDGVSMHPPLWAFELKEKGHGVVFWDEFNTAPPTTQSSALRVIHGGYAGDMKLPLETSHVAAGNPASMVTGGYDLTAAIANRWTHLDWPLPPAEWCEGMISGWPSPEIAHLPKNWKASIAANRGLLAAFIARRPDLLLQLPKSAAEQGKAWPSPRMWSRVADLLTAAESCGYGKKSSVARMLVRGCVGEGAVTEFVQWFTNLDLRDPEEYLADPKGVPLPTRQDQIMATLDAVAAAALDRSKPEKLRAERYYKGWQVIGRVLKTKGDIGIPAGRALANNMPKGIEKALPEELDDILPILEKAGIDFSQKR